MSAIFAVVQLLAAAGPETVINQGIVAYPPAFFAAAQPSNAREMLDRLPGFTFSGGGGVRGYEGAAGNVLVDGQRPASKSDTLDGLLRRIQTSRVARIEIIRGGAPGIDMQGQSVLANIVLKSDSGPKAQVSIGNTLVARDGRNGPQARIVASGGSNDHDWEFGLAAGDFADTRAGDGPNIRLNGGLVPMTTAYSQATGGGSNYQATGAYELPLAGGRLRLSGTIARNPYDVDVTDRTLSPGTSVGRIHASQDDESTELSLRFSRKYSRGMNLEIIALRQSRDTLEGQKDLSHGSLALFDQRSRTEEAIGRAILKQTLSPKFSWELGGEGAANTLRNQIHYSINGTAIPVPSAHVIVNEDRYEAIAKAVWSPAPTWTLEASLRQERSNISASGDTNLAKSLTFTKPRMAVAWAPNPTSQFRFRVERQVGQLRFSDFTARSSLNNGEVTAGNPNLTPEQAWVTEAAWERNFLGQGAIVVQARHFALTDVIDRAPIFTPTGTFDSPANIGSGTKDELGVQLTLPLKTLGLPGLLFQGSSTWRKSEVTDPTTHRKREISGLAAQDWDMSVTWDLPQKKLSMRLSVSEQTLDTKYRLDQIESTKIRPTVVGSVVWNPRPEWTIRAEFRDITDRAIRYTHDQYAGPRNTSGLLFRDDRVERVGPTFFLGVKKTFG